MQPNSINTSVQFNIFKNIINLTLEITIFLIIKKGKDSRYGKLADWAETCTSILIVYRISLFSSATQMYLNQKVLI